MKIKKLNQELMNGRIQEMNKPNSPSEALSRFVNIHGEIHMNAENTAALINWVKSQERNLKESIDSLEELLRLIGPLLGPDQYKDLQAMFESIGQLTRRQ